MHRKINEVEFTIFDTETTGLEPRNGDRIVEIAAVRFKGKRRISTFETLVNPHRPISEYAFQVNRITPQMLEGAPSMEKVAPEFLDFIKGSCICSYNVGFDLEFLNNELRIAKIPELKGVAVVDILKMSKRLMPGLERYALWFVADRLGVKIKQQHRAFSDVELTEEVFFKLNGLLEDKGIIDFKNFLNLFGFNSGLLDDINNQKISQIQEAMNLGVRIKIKYLSSSTVEVTEREVIPKEIRREKGRLYLIGYCYLRNDERYFSIDGILHLEIL